MIARSRRGVRSRRSVQSRRLASAVVGILVLIAVCIGVDAVLDLSDQDGSAGVDADASADVDSGAGAAAAAGAGEEAAAAAGVDAGEGSLSAVRGDGRASAGEEVPAGFEEEVLSLEGRSEVMAAAGGTVVGFLEDGPADAVFDAIEEDLAARGWAEVESGVAGCASFVKEGGRFTWVFVSCVAVGDTTSVVIQCPSAGGR